MKGRLLLRSYTSQAQSGSFKLTNRDAYIFEVLTIVDHILLHILPVWIAVGVTTQLLEGVGAQTSTSSSLLSNHIQFPSNHRPAVLSVLICAWVLQHV